MQGMKMMLLAVGIPACATVVFSITGFAREKTVGRLLQLLGASCLFVVVLAHIAAIIQGRSIPRRNSGPDLRTRGLRLESCDERHPGQGCGTSGLRTTLAASGRTVAGP